AFGFGIGEMRGHVAFPESRESMFQLEIGIGYFRPTAERAAMLAFLLTPAFDIGERFRSRVMEYALQISDIIGGVIFDQRSGLDGRQHGGIDGLRLECIPGD